jgi:Zn-dependent protease
LWVTRLSLAVIAISPGTICITSGLAAVQFSRGKQSGRIWAIACGLAFVALSLPIFVASVVIAYYSGQVSGGWFAIPTFGLILAGAGIFILSAFLPQDSANQLVLQKTPSARIKGDGTNRLSLVIAVIVTLGAMHLGNSLCQNWAQRANMQTNWTFLHTQLILFAALILAIVFHELGHVAAGKMLGMRILAIRIGPFHAALEEGKWQFILPRSLKEVCAASVRMIPHNPVIYNRWQMIGAAAGGALANLLAGMIAVLGVLTAKGSAYEPYWDFLGLIATINLGFLLVNLIPVQEAAAYSDGARIYQILTGSVLEDYRRIVAMTQATTVSRLRPGDLDIDLIERITATNTPNFDQPFLLLVACDYYFDKGHLESASHKFREAEALYDVEATYWAERCGNMVLRATCLLQDRAMAEKWWQRSLSAKSLRPGKKDHFPACAYFAITNRLPEAEEAWRAESERVGHAPESGGRSFDLYYLGRLREMLDEAISDAPIKTIFG